MGSLLIILLVALLVVFPWIVEVVRAIKDRKVKAISPPAAPQKSLMELEHEAGIAGHAKHCLKCQDETVDSERRQLVIQTRYCPSCRRLRKNEVIELLRYKSDASEGLEELCRYHESVLERRVFKALERVE